MEYIKNRIRRKILICLLFWGFLAPLTAQESPAPEAWQEASWPQASWPQASGPQASWPQASGQLPQAALELELRPAAVPPGESCRVRLEITIPEGYYQSRPAEPDSPNPLFGFSLRETPGLRLGPVTYPPGEEKNGLIFHHGDVTLTADLETDPGVSPGTYKIDFTAKYQLCDEGGVCFFPETREVSAMLEILPAAAPGPAAGNAGGAEDAGNTEDTGGAGAGVLYMILLAFLGGLLLNIMPCVLPVLSLKALALVNQVSQGQKDRRAAAVSGLAYAGGVILSLFILALAVNLIRLSGQWVGWGFQFQNPRFLLFLISLVFLFSLSLFDVFTIPAPRLSRTAGGPEKSGWGSFGSGVFAVLLATPCTAPFLGTALGFAFSQPPGYIFLIFLFVGLGLALPFALMGFFPGFTRFIPKPGPWMDSFQKLMAFLLMAVVIWLLSVLGQVLDGRAAPAGAAGGAGLAPALVHLFILALAAWICGRWGGPERKRKTRAAAGVLALALLAGAFVRAFGLPGTSGSPAEIAPETGMTAPGDPAGTAAPTVPAGWERFDPASIRAARERGEPVFLAFSAQWCLTCKTNEQALLLTPWGDAFFSRRGIRRFYGDYTAGDEEIARWIRDFRRAGVPVYVYYPPGAEGIVLPEILTRRILEEAAEGSGHSSARG